MNEKKDVVDRIKNIIEELKPFIMSDGGILDFIDYKDNIVYVKLGGVCQDCAFLDITLKDGIEQMIMNEIEEVKEVRNVN